MKEKERMKADERGGIFPFFHKGISFFHSFFKLLSSSLSQTIHNGIEFSWYEILSIYIA